MKRASRLVWSLLALLALTVPARADIIYPYPTPPDPPEPPELSLLPWLLMLLAVAVTAGILLAVYRKGKKTTDDYFGN